MNKKKIIFIINPNSGTVQKLGVQKLIKQNINRERFDVQLVQTQYAGHATVIAEEACKNNIDIVVAVGGDGTVNEVGRALINTKTVLGIIPCGSGNGLARHLKIPINILKSIEVINNYQVETLDYGIINNIPFFCTSGMGFDAFISMKFAEAGKRGVITYVQKVLEEGLSYEPQTYEIEDESGIHKYKAFLVSVANASQYGNNAYIAPKASMSDGYLDVIIIEPFNLIESPKVALDLFNRNVEKNSKIKMFKAKKIHIYRECSAVIHYDGDPIMTEQDVDIQIVEKGISMIIPTEELAAKPDHNIFQTAFSAFFEHSEHLKEKMVKKSRQFQAFNKILRRKLIR